MISPTREQIIEAMEDAWALTCADSGDKAVEAILSAIASLAAIVPREATEKQSNVRVPGDLTYASIYAAMVEAGDLSREKADG
jgi:hypothetical protein